MCLAAAKIKLSMKKCLLFFFSIRSSKEKKKCGGKKNHWQETILKPNMSTLPCERSKAAAKDSYEIQLTHQQLSFSLLP